MAALILRGPDIAVVGQIPFYPDLGQLPPGHRYRESLATHLLFNSGNNEPRRGSRPSTNLKPG